MSTTKNIWRAASTGDAIALNRCLDSKPAKNRRVKVSNLRDNHNWTVLHHAAASGSTECVELLMSRSDSDPKARCYEGRTALLLACMNDRPVMEVVQWLIDADDGVVNIPNNECVTPLHVVVEKGRLELVELLVANGANVDARDYGGETPLHLALVAGHVEIVIHLLFVGCANPSLHSDVGLNALEILAARGNYAMERKVACFKLVFNYLHSEQQYRQKYSVEDIYTIASISYRSSSLVPYFVRSALIWETDSDQREMMLYLLERCPRYDALGNIAKNHYHMLLLLIVDFDGIQQLDRKIVIRDFDEFVCSRTPLQAELVAFCMIAINQTNGEEHLSMLVKYLHSVKHLLYYCRRNLIPTLAALQGELSHQPSIPKEAFKRYESIVDTIIDINSKPADDVIRRIWAMTPTFPEVRFMRPLVGYSTSLFMYPGNDRIDPACVQEFGAFGVMCEHGEGFSMENVTLQRLARDVIRRTVLEKIDEKPPRVDLEFLRRLESLDLPVHLVRYLRYSRN